jgi:TonB family protein
MFFLRVFVIITLTTSAIYQVTPARDEPELSSLADRLAHEFQVPSEQGLSPKVVVIDFSNQDGMTSVLGERLAEGLADKLAERLGPEHVVAHSDLRGYLLSSGISPFDLQISEVALWNAEKMGANAVVRGQLHSSSEKETTLTVELVRASDEKQLTKASANLSLTDEMKNLADKPLNWPSTPDVAVPCANKLGDQFKAQGMKPPKCISCSEPSFTKEAREAKYNGRVVLKAVIDEQGRAGSAIIIKGAPYGLDATSVSAIKQWQFEPVRKGGKPVSACIVIEMNFHR